MGKSIYTTDYSSKRPGFQLHLQKARGFNGSRHHPPVPKVCDSELFLVFFPLKSNAMPIDFKSLKLTQHGDFEWRFCVIQRQGILLNLLPAIYLVTVLPGGIDRK